MENTNNFILLFHPLNTLYSYDFLYTPRTKHIDKFKELSKNNTTLSLLPYITKEVLDYFRNNHIINHFKYLSISQEESKVIQEEHKLLSLDTYYQCECILLEDLPNHQEKIIFISENINDFVSIVDKTNFCKIGNWMIYKENEDYLNYQENMIPLLSNNHSPILVDMIIECFRQCRNLVNYLFENKDKPDSLAVLVKNFFKNALNVVYILDTDSTSKLYRKRELAQSSQLAKYYPFINKNFPVDEKLQIYPKIHVWLQRCPYYYFKHPEFCKEKIQKVIDQNPSIVQLHPISIVDLLFDRFAVYEFLVNFANNSKKEIENLNMNISIPFSIKVSINKSRTKLENLNEFKKKISESKNLSYPFIIKPLSCTKHEMELILNEKGLETLFENEEKYNIFFVNNQNFIIQQYINHGGVMIKNYSINEESYSFIRPSLPDMKSELIHSKELSSGSMSFYNEIIYQKKSDVLFKDVETEEEKKVKEKINMEIEKIDKLSLLFVKNTKITFYGLDFLYDSTNNLFYILEINYFPSYRELGDKLHIKFDEHIVKYYNKYKK